MSDVGQSSDPLSIAQIVAMLEAATPTAVALATGSAVTVASWLVDSYGSRGGWLVLTKTDGSRIRRRVHVTVDSPAGGADATAAYIEASGGLGTHADFTAGTFIELTSAVRSSTSPLKFSS